MEDKGTVKTRLCKNKTKTGKQGTKNEAYN